MNLKDDVITNVLAAADGKITGRIRFQKIFYLLEQLGLGQNISFSYHHYGPYSEDLSSSIDIAAAFNPIIAEQIVPSDGGFYSIYSLKNPPHNISQVGNLPWKDAHEYVSTMLTQSSVILELAATIHWLCKKEKVSDWRTELKTRKRRKATDDNIKQAEALLAQLKIAV